MQRNLANPTRSPYRFTGSWKILRATSSQKASGRFCFGHKIAHRVEEIKILQSENNSLLKFVRWFIDKNLGKKPKRKLLPVINYQTEKNQNLNKSPVPEKGKLNSAWLGGMETVTCQNYAWHVRTLLHRHNSFYPQKPAISWTKLHSRPFCP